MGGVSPVADEDSTLIARCRAQDRAAFDELVLKYQDRVYSLAYRLTGNPEDAADVAQEAFLKVYRNIDGFRGGASFYTWMYRIAVNTVISRRRYDSARPQPVSLDAADLEGRAASSAAPDPSDAASRAELQRLVAEAISRLEDPHRVLIVLRDIQGHDYDEIAEILDCPRGTVKSRLHRARCALRQALEPLLPADSAL